MKLYTFLIISFISNLAIADGLFVDNISIKSPKYPDITCNYEVRSNGDLITLDSGPKGTGVCWDITAMQRAKILANSILFENKSIIETANMWHETMVSSPNNAMIIGCNAFKNDFNFSSDFFLKSARMAASTDKKLQIDVEKGASLAKLRLNNGIPASQWCN
ncbi:hypothetical protein NMD96_12930 [Edwardsiella tarda]|uniref:hypothetical protein n=1 Tax=Edwardsiella tarda TaxID=636 RepID=UPI00351C1BC5